MAKSENWWSLVELENYNNLLATDYITGATLIWYFYEWFKLFYIQSLLKIVCRWHNRILCRSLTYSELDTLSEWFNWNMLTTSSSRTQALTLQPSTYNYSLKINDLPVEVKQSLKILGVNMCDKLKLTIHVNEQLKNDSAKCAALHGLKRMVGLKTIMRVYKAYILAHLE